MIAKHTLVVKIRVVLLLYLIGKCREPRNQCFSSCWYLERTLYLYYNKVLRADYISRSTKICSPSAARILVH
jgi:hypothetical protein